jgi:putative ATPase
MKDLGYGENYQYAHNYKDNFVRENYFPDELEATQFFRPGDNPREEEMRKRLDNLWKDIKDYGTKQ